MNEAAAKAANVLDVLIIEARRQLHAGLMDELDETLQDIRRQYLAVRAAEKSRPLIDAEVGGRL